MRRAGVLLAIGVLALVVQGAAATIVAPPLCPNFGLLVVIAMALRWRGAASGLFVAFLLGYAADLLSGSLLGQHALLHLFVFATARIVVRQLNFHGGLPLAVFAGVVILIYGVALVALTGFFVGSVELRWSWLGDELIHAAVSALFAPAVSAGVGRISSWFAEGEAVRHTLEVSAGGRPA
jgi:rod shape-determining protein MreD